MLAKNFRLKIHLGDSITDLEAGKGRERRQKKKEVLFIRHDMKLAFQRPYQAPHAKEHAWERRRPQPGKWKNNMASTDHSCGVDCQWCHSHSLKCSQYSLNMASADRFFFFFFRSMRMETILPADCQFVHLPSWDFAFNETQLHYIDGTLGWRQSFLD